MWLSIVAQALAGFVAVGAFLRELSELKTKAKGRRAWMVMALAAVAFLGMVFSVLHEFSSDADHRAEIKQTGEALAHVNSQNEDLAKQLGAARVSLEDQARDCNARQIAEEKRMKSLMSCIADARTRKKAEGIGSEFTRNPSANVGVNTGVTTFEKNKPR